ncbi:MAG: 3-ketoacyl-ACP reductase [Verrucomicrobiales bacterium]
MKPIIQPPVVLVTGASRGLGRGIAIELAKAGMSVGIHYAGNEVAAHETAAICAEVALHGELQQFEPVQADIGDSAERNALFSATLAMFGRLDALVNNAGITSVGRLDIVEATEESFDRVIDVNLKAPYFLSQSAGNYWLANPGDSRLAGGYKLVFIGSVSADTASLNRGDYCLSKAALGMANHLWALRLAEVAQVIELRPGVMATDMTSAAKDKYDRIIAEGELIPMRRWGTGEDVGRGVVSFLQNDWPFSTGEVITIDGGMHLKKL